jgi:predicted porin
MNGGLLKVAGHGAIAALAGVLLNADPAQAADLGGNCCADLEERVAELEATTVRKGNRRVSLTLSGHVNRSILYWNDDFDHDIYSVDNAIANSRFRLTGTGKINADLTAGFYMEFGMALGARSHQVSQVDDDGFAGSGGILAGAVFGDGIGGAGDSVIDFNQSYWYINSKHWGRLSVGRLSTTTAGISVIDLSNTGVIANSQPFLWGGGFFTRNGLGQFGLSWGNLCGGPSVGTTVLPPTILNPGAGAYATDCGIHALSRHDAVMYTTPTWHGFTFGASFGEDDFWDASARYAGEWHGFRIAAGVGYRRYDDREVDFPTPLLPLVSPKTGQLNDTDRRAWLSSASLMHIATGLFVSGTWTQYQFHGANALEIFDLNPFISRPDINLWWVDAGIQKNWTGWGNTTFYGEYGRVDDGITGLVVSGATAAGALAGLGGQGVIVDSDMSWWGLGAVQTIDAAAMDLYIGYRRYSADAFFGNSVTLGLPAVQIPGGMEDIWYIQAGARIQF